MPTSTRAVGIQILLKPYSKNGRASRADRVVRPYGCIPFRIGTVKFAVLYRREG